MHKEKEAMRDKMSDIIQEIMMLESEPDCIYTRRLINAKRKELTGLDREFQIRWE